MLDSESYVRLLGNVARAAEAGATRSGAKVTNITVVTVAAWRDAAGVEHEESTFIPCECFGGNAAFAAGLAAGDRVVVEGRLKTAVWGAGAEKKSKMLVSVARILRVR